MWFTAFSVAAWLLVAGTAYLRRGRFYAIFALVLMGLHTLISAAIAPHLGRFLGVAIYLQATVYLHFFMLSAPRMRPVWYRALISLPGSFFWAGTFLAFPWAIAAAFGATPHGLWIPYALASIGLVDSFLGRGGIVDVVIDRTRAPQMGRVRKVKVRDQQARPLRVVQITDPHLGPFMPVDRLHAICERAVEQAPDLVVLTGDFLTMESHSDPELLANALAPLKALPGRCFACLGNHDYEALEHVQHGLRSAGVTLLVDEMTTANTALGEIEVIGYDFHFRDRREKLQSVSAQLPRNERFRIGLLHDPGGFHHLPAGAADLVLSGHTHGGQLGLLWFGLSQTVVSALSSIPDHGLWSRGADLLYVHRGTGHYGFPIRVGVPPEESVLHVHMGDASAT